MNGLAHTVGCLAKALALVIGFCVVAFWIIAHQFEEAAATDTRSLVAMLGASSVLAVLAHPDDEILISSLLVDAAERPNVTVRTITVTHGEAGQGPASVRPPGELATVRAGELARYGVFLGLDDQVLWGYPDGGLRNDRIVGLERDVIAAIREWKPDLVVSFEPNTGFTLHPDHMAVGRVAEFAIRVSGDISVMPETGPPHSPRWIAFVLAPRRMLNRFGGSTGRETATAQPAAAYAVPSNRKAKIEGWKIHASQGHVIKELFGVSPSVLYTLWGKEHYVVHEMPSIAGAER
jgi:LmbE family N-acetylglucosaminyl deacetylase